MFTLSGKQPIVFDRDNTLILSDGYLGDPERVVLMPGAAEAVARARRLGYAVVVVSNQSGVARGMFTEDAVRAVNARMEALLLAENPEAVIDREEFCPFHPAAALLEYKQDSELRKPKPGMIVKAVGELGLERGGWCVGDAPRDVAAGKAAGLRTILFVPRNVPRSPAADEPMVVNPDFQAATLSAAMDIVERETKAVHMAHTQTNQVDTSKMERTLEQLLVETRRVSQPHSDFSVPKLLAGILQIMTLALLFMTYFNHDDKMANKTVFGLLLAIFMQTLVSSLLLMARQR